MWSRTAASPGSSGVACSPRSPCTRKLFDHAGEARAGVASSSCGVRCVVHLRKRSIADCQLTCLRFLCCAVIAGLAKKELEKYGLTGWYPTVVMDAGSNIAAAFDRPHFADWMRCCCHVLHNTRMVAAKLAIRNTPLSQIYNSTNVAWQRSNTCTSLTYVVNSFLVHGDQGEHTTPELPGDAAVLLHMVMHPMHR